ncbi:hypothetical protein N7467_003079 [Penicillium canescens]|nr:hypothetical protein N7467_003079 [Penicillium canescens]
MGYIVVRPKNNHNEAVLYLLLSPVKNFGTALERPLKAYLGERPIPYRNFLDGYTRYSDVRNGLDKQRRQDFFRLNTELLFLIRLDDLDISPIYDRGFYLYEGSIRCRGVYKNIVNALITLYQPKIEFITANETLASLDL